MHQRPLARRLVFRLTSRLRRARNRLFYRCAGGEERAVFHDPAAICPELLEIDRQYAAIRAELDAILDERGRFPLYHEADKSQVGISGADEGDWRVFFLHIAHPEVPLSNAQLCPRTAEIVRGIPGVLVAFFSILEPGVSVPAHSGPSYTYLRYHTGLVVPRDRPPSMRVRDRHHTWKEGESLLFDDSWEHEVTNESDQVRVVLIVDIERPVPWPAKLFSRLVMRANALTMSEAEWAQFDERVRVRR